MLKRHQLPLYASWLAAISVLATLVSQGIAPALPGSDVGIEQWIVRLDRLSGWLTQLTLLSGMGVCGALISLLMVPSKVPLSFRGLALLSAFGVTAIVTSAIVQQPGLSVSWHLALVILTGALAAHAVWLCVRTRTTRAAALALGLIALGGLSQSIGSYIALGASEAARSSLFGVARGFATARLGAYALSLAAAAIWFVGKRPRMHGLLLLVPLALSAWVIHAAAGAAANGNGLTQVLALRSLQLLTTHPNPLVGTTLHYYVEIVGLTLAWVVLVKPKSHAAARACMALCLASRGHLDVPLCALMVTCAALLLALAAEEPIHAEPAGNAAG